MNQDYKRRDEILGELDKLFGRMRSALRAESKHERDIVRLDLESLEESVKQIVLAEFEFSPSALELLLYRLNNLREEAKNLYGARESILAELTKLEELLRGWFPVEEPAPKTANRLRDLPSVITEMHGYFLSYSQKDSAEADHIESLLRRQSRAVFRDEVHFEAGRDLNDAISERIRNADTFVALWSEKYRSSSWCLGELNFSRDLADRSMARRRLILIELDDEEIPPRFANVLRLSGRDRARRELAVAKMVAEE